jgi:hypothetical protein
MRRVMLFTKSWRRQHKRSGKACGLILSRCRRGNGDGDAVSVGGGINVPVSDGLVEVRW